MGKWFARHIKENQSSEDYATDTTLTVVTDLGLREAVYDAAMAWFKEQNARPRNPERESAAWIAFREACRAAEEVERG